eukprot:TRINITY_DN3059_c0_g2_i1.p10 TRINITY_DN3059_c0_g2~~TRINITY_DN3059_c0_g2_i1.p10  ORF type:complete len:146 (-),score=6.56 TRINITY_DN3059_c0_g2_i1:2280-2717(-)
MQNKTINTTIKITKIKIKIPSKRNNVLYDVPPQQQKINKKINKDVVSFDDSDIKPRTLPINEYFEPEKYPKQIINKQARPLHMTWSIITNSPAAAMFDADAPLNIDEQATWDSRQHKTIVPKIDVIVDFRNNFSLNTGLTTSAMI